jgi:ATP-dependent RNA/DNA helicase IGHMBP2
LLNESQQIAVQAIVNNEQLCIVHGPPGTGKTTTLLEAIHTLVQQGEKIVVAAPSNTAVDHIAQGLIMKKINILRIGNISKVNEIIYPHTIEGKMADAALRKEIKQLKIRAEEFRKMALRYKRSFGKAEREQRSLLFKEVKTIRDDIKKLVAYQEEKLVTDAKVILGTPIGLQSSHFKMNSFDTLFLDEAGQCLEPLAWCIFPFAKRYVLAGDHLQLPPTVLSDEAYRLGFSTSILEACIPSIAEVFLLDTQYRMRKSIAGFSSDYFYNSLLQTPSHLQNISQHIHFYDTAGMGYEEQHGSDGTSLQNEGELLLASKIMELEKWLLHESAFISPYAAQIALAKNHFPSSLRISTIDSFQGQEKKNIFLSLVRSNDQCQIGFLQDYRRMNVALTRAKETLIVIGDSATLGKDPFYQHFLSYVEKHGVYTSGWEFIE